MTGRVTAKPRRSRPPDYVISHYNTDVSNNLLDKKLIHLTHSGALLCHLNLTGLCFDMPFLKGRYYAAMLLHIYTHE
ncbi:hypothetical protein K1T71_005369 [Dendrolimus kikuchii]|uniref:Uncharacterized protein n=1 Tax=Dendrolimus kikuchii TaxID=765133 RepID=A0ACC1D3T6_9NEOP|nr:hypothetical protein K1T71_005369 [Dendrolimus kikuchii]